MHHSTFLTLFITLLISSMMQTSLLLLPVCGVHARRVPAVVCRLDPCDLPGLHWVKRNCLVSCIKYIKMHINNKTSFKNIFYCNTEMSNVVCRLDKPRSTFSVYIIFIWLLCPFSFISCPSLPSLMDQFKTSKTIMLNWPLFLEGPKHFITPIMFYLIVYLLM